jgi:hypothetical protein
MQSFLKDRSNSIAINAIMGTVIGGYSLWKRDYCLLGAGLNWLIRSATLFICEDSYTVEKNVDLTSAVGAGLLTYASYQNSDNNSLVSIAGTGLTFLALCRANKEVEDYFSTPRPRFRPHTYRP